MCTFCAFFVFFFFSSCCRHRRYEREELAQSLEARHQEKLMLSEVQAQLAERRQKLLREEQRRRQLLREANEKRWMVTPGPGDYHVPTREIKGGMWSTHESKTELEVSSASDSCSSFWNLREYAYSST